MATVTGKTSTRIDELLDNTVVGADLTSDGRLLFLTRGGAIVDQGKVLVPLDLDQLKVELQDYSETVGESTRLTAQEYADLLVSNATITFEQTISENEATVKAYSDAQLASEVAQIEAAMAAGDADATQAAADALAAEVAAIEASVAAGDALAAQQAADALAAEAARIDSDIQAVNGDVLNLVVDVESLRQSTDSSIGEVSDLVSIINRATKSHHGIY